MYYQRNVPPPAKIYSFTLENFVGGLNNRDQIPEENQCTSVLNMSFTQDGLMEKRKGIKPFDETTLDGAVTFIDEYKPHQEENVLIRATKDKMYVGSTLLRNVQGQVHGVNHEGKYFFCDSAGLWVYGRFDETAGTYVKLVGTATHDYLLMEVVSPPEGFTPLGTEHTQGVRVIDYTNRKVWYEPCVNEIKDTFKQGNVIPEKPRFIVVREGRLYVAGGDKDDDNVHISDTGNPYYFPASLPIQLPPNSDRIAGLAHFDNAIVVGRRLDMHVITGDTNRTDAGLPVFRLRRLNAHFGFASQRAVVNAHNFLFFLATDSQFYILRTVGETGEQLATTNISKTVDIHAEPIAVQPDDIWNASGIFFGDCYYCAVGNKVLVYHYIHQAWTVYDQIEATSFHKVFTTLMMGCKDGKIVIESNDYLDLGKPYQAHWRSRYLNMGDANAFKMFKEFFIISRTSDTVTSRVNLLFEVDHADIRANVDLRTKFSIWGKSVFGDRFVNRNVNTSQYFPLHRRGRGIRITFWNSEHISATVADINELENVLDIHDGIIVKVTADDKYYTHEDGQWRVMLEEEYNQHMCVQQMSGEYEFKWKR